METMRYTENKKSSKGVAIGLFLFILIGGVLIFLAMKSEKDPVIIGEKKSDIQKLVELDASSLEAEKEKNASIKYEIKDRSIEDNTNKKITGKITLPEIYVEGIVLADVNDSIEKDYSDTFAGLKEQMGSAENKFQYLVSYTYYDNMVGSKKVVSIVINQKIIDLANSETTMEKINTYNVDLVNKAKISQSEIARGILGVDYKTILRSKVLNYVVENQMMSEDDFTYTITGLENFYIKENKLYIIFNPEELVDKKYGILEIEIDK
ncbi:MAG: hypothetical protein Q4D02_02115 [Clostridia bacterium]|nr:hypothetical protein [Clostridia bacterium]